MLKKLKNKLANCTATLLFALVMSCGYFIVLEPANDVLSRLEDGREILISRLKENERVAINLSKHRAELWESQKINDSAEYRLRGNELGSEGLLSAFAEEATKHSVTLIALIPQQVEWFVIPGEGYVFLEATPYETRVSGTLASLIHFLTAVSERTQGNGVFRDLSIQPDSANNLIVTVRFIFETGRLHIIGKEPESIKPRPIMVVDRSKSIAEPAKDWREANKGDESIVLEEKELSLNYDLAGHYQKLADFTVGQLFPPLFISEDKETRRTLLNTARSDDPLAPILLQELWKLNSFVRKTTKYSPSMAHNALVESKDKDAVPVIIELTEASNRNIRLAALMALAELKSTAAEEKFIKYLHDSDPEIQAAAIYGLGRIASQKAILDIAEVLAKNPDLLNVDHIEDGIKAYKEDTVLRTLLKPVISVIKERIDSSPSCQDIGDHFQLLLITYRLSYSEELAPLLIKSMQCEKYKFESGLYLLVGDSVGGKVAFYETIPQGSLVYQLVFPPAAEAALLAISQDTTLADSIKKRAWYDLLNSRSLKAVNSFLTEIPYPALVDNFAGLFLLSIFDGAYRTSTYVWGFDEKYDYSSQAQISLRSLTQLNRLDTEGQEKIWEKEIFGREINFSERYITERSAADQAEWDKKQAELDKRTKKAEELWREDIIYDDAKFKKWQQEHRAWFALARLDQYLEKKDIAKLYTSWQMARDAMLAMQQMRQVDKKLPPAERALKYKKIINAFFADRDPLQLARQALE
jgi:Tfp pilus assembly protein PilO